MGAAAKEAGAPVRLGIAGLGLAGSMMIRAAAIHPRIELCAAADPLERPRAAFAADFGAPAYAEFRALCEDREVEAVYVASPHELHAAQAILALQRGKHVLVEKPMALTLEDCDRVIAAADRAGGRLLVGHTHAYDPNVRFVRALLKRGELGRLGMILTFNYNDFLYRPRRPEELDAARGGGVAFNQVAHQIEILRLLGGGLVRSVRANLGALDPDRPTEGNCMALLEFEDGAAASLAFSAYDGFDSDEFCDWVAEGGGRKTPGRHGAMRRRLRRAPDEEAARQAENGYGGAKLPTAQPHLPHFGVLIVTCERGDVRLSPDGVLVYGPEGRRELPVPRGVGRPGHGDALDALCAAVREGKRDFRDARWGKATLEVALAIRRSARERREIRLAHQTPADDD